jgi:hypothetical protein
MKNQTQHTPTPWKADGKIIRGADGLGVCELQRQGFPSELKANTAFIITACNAHEELVQAVKWALDDARTGPLKLDTVVKLQTIQAALKKAGVK